VPRPERSHRLEQRYTNEAEAYKKLWAPVVEVPSRNLLCQLPLNDATCVVDVGTGVGTLLPHLQKMAPSALVVGVDHAEGMLKWTPEGFFRVRADASQLSFLPNVFDVGVMMFMLFHLPDPVLGLLEIRSLLRKGGTVGIATWGQDPGFPAYKVWIEELDRQGAEQLDPANELTQHHLVDTTEKIEALLVKAGYESVKAWTGICNYQSRPEEFISRRTLFGLGKRRLDSLSLEDRNSCLRALRSRLDKLDPQDFIMHKEVIFACAQKAL